MGICSSCLGIGRRSSDSENPETSRLLHDESYRSQYGSVQQYHRTTNQPDPESLRREREALESICHAMSDNVVDIFTAIPEPSAQTQKSPSPASQRPKSSDTSPETQAYKSIRRGRAGPIAPALNTDKYGWEAAKTTIIGTGQDSNDLRP